MDAILLGIDENSYHLSDDLVDISEFKTSDLKLDKKTWKYFDIYCINCVKK